jgi:murein DD-endopeptidase MepM/ murein hydrolase activator NlpD
LVPPPPVKETLPGFYHRAERGQTLWRISKIYDVGLEELIRLNHISDNSSIEIGQLIFIPYGRQKQSTISIEDFIWPIKGQVISGFGGNYNNMMNKGINIRPFQTKEVVSSRSGKVVFYSPHLEGFGKTVIIDHGDGFLTVYARNSEVFVKTGDSVEKGVIIANVGRVGRDKNTYLHFEIRKDHIPQNPYFYLTK